MITPEKVRELLEAATPGPWRVEVAPWAGYNTTVNDDSADRALIAAAPEIAAAYLELAEAFRLLQDGIGDIRTEIIKDM